MDYGISPGQLFGRDIDELRTYDIDELGVLLLGALRTEPAVRTREFFLLLRQQMGHAGMDPPDDDLLMSLQEAWRWCRNEGHLAPDAGEGDSEVVTRSGKALSPAHVADVRMTRLLRLADLDHDLREAVVPLFRQGAYDLAVLAAMRLVEVAVREEARLGEGDIGTRLMRRAFGPSGRLREAELDQGEADARADLFAGAMGTFKNPASHRLASTDDAQSAAEAVLLANALLRMVFQVTARVEDAENSAAHWDQIGDMFDKDLRDLR